MYLLLDLQPAAIAAASKDKRLSVRKAFIFYHIFGLFCKRFITIYAAFFFVLPASTNSSTAPMSDRPAAIYTHTVCVVKLP